MIGAALGAAEEEEIMICIILLREATTSVTKTSRSIFAINCELIDKVIG